MRYLVLGDIHSNLEALQAVRQYKDYERVLLLGDLVGYGADPGETIHLVQEMKPVAMVRGNHDKVVAGLEEGDLFVSHALESALWTRKQLSEESLRYLRDLPEGPIRVDSQVTIVHGAPFDEDAYLLPHAPASSVFDGWSTPVCFFGHTHIPTVFCRVGSTTYSSQVEQPAKMVLNLDSSRYLVNPGSVGQPRDGDPRAAFVVFDTNTKVIEFFRVDYDIRTAQEKIREAGLPVFLSQRLARGT
ncbi:MAG TPA: metallophosphoesterase family protein [Acidobacteriota bacterium]|jgi:diadenosine tetraphosphatase ApaH/serine/threonine PP2A family protein phosphatase